MAVLILLLVCCASQGALGQQTEPDPDELWVSNLLQEHGEIEGFERNIDRLRPLLKDKTAQDRLIRFLRRSAVDDLVSQERPAQTTWATIRLLGYAGSDEAMDAIAPYLNHLRAGIRDNAAYSLRLSGNPKGVAYLKRALIEAEMHLPPPPAVTDTRSIRMGETMSILYHRLSEIHSDEARAILDASLKRLRLKYKDVNGGNYMRELDAYRAEAGPIEAAGQGENPQPGARIPTTGPGDGPVSPRGVSSQKQSSPRKVEGFDGWLYAGLGTILLIAAAIVLVRWGRRKR